MKTFLFTSLPLLQLVLVAGTTASGDERHRFEYDPKVAPPVLDFDLDTIKACTIWYDNLKDMSCEEVRYMFAITPEDFTRWNPSITLDCGNWKRNSYCIQVSSEMTTTLTGPPGPTSTTDVESVPTQSPTPPLGTPSAWEPLGCYLNNDTASPAMAKQVTPDGGDLDLTVDRCQKMCFEDDWEVYLAGVEGGNTCWCSSSIVNDMAEDQTSCNIPCTGDSKETCGGKELISVYKAVYGEVSESPTELVKTQTPTKTSDAASSIAATAEAERVDSMAASSGDPWLCGSIIATLMSWLAYA